VLVCWFLPVKFGCGSFTCSVSRAVHPRSNSLAFASDPFEAELSKAAWPTMLLRIKVVAALLALTVVAVAHRDRRRGGASALLAPRNHARAVAAALGAGGLAWFVVIAVMTQVGFSGNNRYLVLGAALVDICAAIGYGWAARELAVGLGRWLSGRGARSGRPRPATSGGLLQAGTVGFLALIFAFGPNWVGSNLVSIPRTHGSLVYQAHLRTAMSALTERFGGARKVLACGTVMTEGFQVPLVSWTLGVPTTRVQAPPVLADPGFSGPAPNVILQTRDTRSASLLPFLSSWPEVTYHYVATIGPVHMFTHDCPSR
jgi:hypothetical protein